MSQNRGLKTPHLGDTWSNKIVFLSKSFHVQNVNIEIPKLNADQNGCGMSSVRLQRTSKSMSQKSRFFDFLQSTKTLNYFGNLENKFSEPSRCNRRLRNKKIYRTPTPRGNSSDRIASYARLKGANVISVSSSSLASTPP